jgi:hypothetical protein
MAEVPVNLRDLYESGDDAYLGFVWLTVMRTVELRTQAMKQNQSR